MKTHIGLHVSDIKKTVEFYNQFFGKTADKMKVDYAKYELEDSGLVISFEESPANVAPQTAHFGFRVESSEQLESKLHEMTEKGLVKLKEMGTGCCYAKQDKFWVADPDGYRWEVYHFVQDIEVNELDTACCN